MISKQDYEQQKRNMVHFGKIPEGFIPYMYNYYKHMCIQKEIPEVCTEEQFPESLKAFFSIPVQRPNTKIATPESLKVAVDRVINHFDKLYTI